MEPELPKLTHGGCWSILAKLGYISMGVAVETAREFKDTRERRDVDQDMAMIEKSQQLAGHFPDAEALGRARRILEGELTEAEAYAELDAKYSR
jgi:hypothetical protein